MNINNFEFNLEGINSYFSDKGRHSWHYLVTSYDRNKNLYINGKLVVPLENKTKILDFIYDNSLALPATEPFYDYVKQRYYGISYRDVDHYIKSKKEWQYMHNVNRKTIMPVIYYSPGHFQIDLTILNKKEKPDEYNYIMNCIDIYSHYAISIPLYKKDTETTSNAIKKYLKTMHFKSVQTDNGVEFKKEFDNVLKKHNIKHIFSEPHRWETQGLIERFNGTIKRYIKMDMIKASLKRESFILTNDLLQKYVNAYNHTKQDTLGGYTPYDLFFINDIDMYNKRLSILEKKLEHFSKRSSRHFNIGDNVRVRMSKIEKHTLFKYSRRIYTIIGIVKPKEPWQPIKYILDDGRIMNGVYLLKIPH